jgi:flagellar biosynthesis anti-sigma factor FlgM
MNIPSDKSYCPVDPLLCESGAMASRRIHPSSSPTRMAYADQLSLSPRAREIQQASRILAQTLEMQETRVVALMHEIESGNYQLQADWIADKLLKEQLFDLFI